VQAAMVALPRLTTRATFAVPGKGEMRAGGLDA